MRGRKGTLPLSSGLSRCVVRGRKRYPATFQGDVIDARGGQVKARYSTCVATAISLIQYHNQLLWETYIYTVLYTQSSSSLVVADSSRTELADPSKYSERHDNCVEIGECDGWNRHVIQNPLDTDGNPSYESTSHPVSPIFGFQIRFRPLSQARRPEVAETTKTLPLLAEVLRGRHSRWCLSFVSACTL